MVSICVVTYNHEKYIKHAIESILAQKVDFEYEIVIGDDCSTDDTASIVQAYAEKYNCIHAVLRQKNIGLKSNLIDIFSQARGKYIATLEGDDYWIDDYKLAKQVGFLEENPDYVLVCTNSLTFSNEDKTKLGLLRASLDSFDFGLRDLMIYNPGSTLTAVFRNGLVNEFPDIFYKSSACDRRLYILLSQYGKCKYLRDVTAAYRVHATSITSIRRSTYYGRLELELEGIRNAILWNEYLDGNFLQEVEIVQRKNSKTIVYMALSNRDFGNAINYSKWVCIGELQTIRSRIIVGILQNIRKIGEYLHLFASDPLSKRSFARVV